MSWLRDHGEALRAGANRMRSSPWVSLLSVLAIGIALALPTLGQLVIDNAQRLVRQSASEPHLSVYLDLSATAADAKALGDTLARHPAIAGSEFIAREATLERYRKDASLRDVLDVLPRNPFPHAFVVRPRDSTPANLSALASEIRALPVVEHVQLDSDWVRRLDAAIRLLRAIVLLGGTAFAIALVAITFSLTRLQVLVRLDEITLSEMLGATPGYVRRPFLYHGALLGASGSLAALVLVGLAGIWLEPLGQAMLQTYGIDLPIVLLTPRTALHLVAAAVGLGWLGAAMSIWRHLQPGEASA